MESIEPPLITRKSKKLELQKRKSDIAFDLDIENYSPNRPSRGKLKLDSESNEIEAIPTKKNQTPRRSKPQAIIEPAPSESEKSESESDSKSGKSKVTRLPKKVNIVHTNTGRQTKLPGELTIVGGGGGGGALSTLSGIPIISPGKKTKQPNLGIKSTNFVSDVSISGRESLAVATHIRFDDLAARKLQQTLTTESSEMKIRTLFAAFSVREEALSASMVTSSLSVVPSAPRGRGGKGVTRPTASSASRTAILSNSSSNTTSHLDAENKRLKDAVQSFLSEFRKLKEGCLAAEILACNLFRDSNLELEKTLNFINAMSTNETLLKTEIRKLQQAHSEMSEKFSDLKSSHSPIRNKVNEFENRNNHLQEACEAEREKRTRIEAELLRVEAEAQSSKTSAAESILFLKQQLEKACEELDLLKLEASEKNLRIEKQLGEVAEAERRVSEMREEVLRAQSLQRETESFNHRHEREVSRLQQEVEAVKEQLTAKDGDLRATLASLNHLQSQSGEEKAAMRAEISVIQTRLQALEAERLQSTAELATRREEALSAAREQSHLREQLSSLEAKLEARETELLGMKDTATQLEVERELRSRSELREEAERRERIAASSQLLATQTEFHKQIQDFESRLTECARQKHEQEDRMGQERSELEAQKTLLRERTLILESEIEQLKRAVEQASSNSSSQAVSIDSEAVKELGQLKGELEIMKWRMKDTVDSKVQESSAASARIEQLEEQIRQGEAQRRKLHNTIQELRGNIRVFARVRPFIGEQEASDPSPTLNPCSDGSSLKISRQVLTSNNGVNQELKLEEHSFHFDRTFGPSASQETVFQEVSEFVQSALDGFQVCLFSYGQTGSGKTHTMQGSGTEDQRGIIPRAMEQVGRYKRELEAQAWQYEMRVSYIEIYNETIRDLLRPADKGYEELRHEIKIDSSGGVYVSDVKMIDVDPNNREQIQEIIIQAARHRSVATTAMNDQSSRSHSIFTLHLRAINHSNNNFLRGSLSLVDLAGSERLDRSGATGQTAKEASAINKSLSCLTDVFLALSNKQRHIPYRNSKLTYLLQQALSDEGKTLMLVNLSPTNDSYFESLCSLRFASQVNKCELGKPRRQIKDTGAFAPLPPSLSLPSSEGEKEEAVSLPTTSSSSNSLSSTLSSTSSPLLPPRSTPTKSAPKPRNTRIHTTTSRK